MQNKIIQLSIIFLLFSGILNSQEIQFSEGEKIKSASSGKHFLVLDKQLREIETNILISGLFKDFRNPIVVSDSVLNTLHFGSKINEAFLIRSYSNEIYLYINEQRRHIESPEVMEAFDFNWNYLRRMTPDELNLIPSGDKITTDGSQIYPLPCGVRDNE